VIEEPRETIVSLEPLDDYVVIEPTDEESETRHGLIIPASAENACRTGIVTAAGPDAAGIEPGDKVLFPRDVGYDVRLVRSSHRVRVLKRDDVIARVHD
jgi:co-chaperonin GroES (HSP10)